MNESSAVEQFADSLSPARSSLSGNIDTSEDRIEQRQDELSPHREAENRDSHRFTGEVEQSVADAEQRDTSQIKLSNIVALPFAHVNRNMYKRILEYFSPQNRRRHYRKNSEHLAPSQDKMQ